MKKPSIEFLFSVETKIQDVQIPYMYFDSLVIKKEYLKYRFPFMFLTLKIPPSFFYEILRDVDISKPIVKVNLNTFYKDTDLDEESPSRLYTSGNYIGVIDKPYISFNPHVYGKSMENDMIEPEQENKTLRIGLYKKNDINSFQHDYLNAVIKNFTITDAIGWAFNTTTKDNMKLIMSPPDNTRRYTKDLVPPMGFYQFIDYLDNEMGIYDTDYNIFIDDGIVYLLNHKNDHGIRLKSSDKYEKTIKIRTIASDEGPRQNSLDASGDWTYYVVEEADIENKLILEKFGRADTIISNLNGELDTQTYSGINTLKLKSNRFDYYTKNKYDREVFDIYLGDLPLDVRPYTYIKLEGKLSNNKYRIAGYTTVIQGKRSISKLELLRVT
ncbi:MAG: hypothetical protein ACOCRK_02045 [bacterium]